MFFWSCVKLYISKNDGTIKILFAEIGGNYKLFVFKIIVLRF